MVDQNENSKKNNSRYNEAIEQG